MRSHPRFWGFVLLIVLSGCAGVSRFEKGPLVAFGEPMEGNPAPNYYLIRINLEKQSDTRVQQALLRLNPEAPPSPINGLRPELVARYLKPFSPPPQWPQAWREQSRADETFAGGGFNIAFKQGRLVYVGICSNCAGTRQSPVVGTPDGLHFYSLPLRRDQLIDVFGLPARIYRVNEVRY